MPRRTDLTFPTTVDPPLQQPPGDAGKFDKGGRASVDDQIRALQAFALANMGGSSTLAGDVTGPSGSNVVTKITGSAGLALVAAGGLFWLPNTVGAAISQQARTSDLTAQDFVIQSQAPFASASTNKGSGNLNLGTAAPLAGGATGAINLQPGGSTAIQVLADTAQGAAAALAFGASPSTIGIVRVPYTAGAQTILSRKNSGAVNVNVIGSSGDLLFFGDANNGAATAFSSGAGNCTLQTGNGTYVQLAYGSGNVVVSTTGMTLSNAPSSGTAITLNAPWNGAASVVFSTTVTSAAVNVADNTTNSATGIVLKVQSQNATGTTTTGGELQVGPGTGTTANGKLNLINIITGTTVGAAGAGSALPATPAGYMNIKINGTAQRIPYYA